MFIMNNILTGYLQSLGGDLYHASQPISHLTILSEITIAGVVVGVGLILYDVFSNRRKPLTMEEVRRQINKDELDQIDKQNSERNEGDDKYTPAGIK
jgi:hypothetical protein